jgi:hypothetical protein
VGAAKRVERGAVRTAGVEVRRARVKVREADAIVLVVVVGISVVWCCRQVKFENVFLPAVDRFLILPAIVQLTHPFFR